MKLTDLHARLKQLNEPILRTGDVVAYLNVNNAHASMILARLADYGHIVRVKRGLWVFPDKLDPLALPEHLTAPFPCYVSLQSALYYHDMISQIPEITYAVSLARTKIIKTPPGVFSIHHVTPSFFFGYTIIGKSGIKMATPEKALLDFLYMGPAKSKLFRSLPELELPRKFSIRTALQMISQAGHSRRITLLKRRFENLMERNRFRNL